MFGVLGTRLASGPASAEACLAPLVEGLLRHRAELRAAGNYDGADGVRGCLAAAGVVALMMSANPALGPDEIETLLLETADDRGTLG